RSRGGALRRCAGACAEWVFSVRAGAGPRCRGRVPFDEAPDRVTAEGLAARSGKDGIGALAPAFGEVVLHHCDGQLGERGRTFFPALAGAVYEGAGAEVEVVEAERAELADAQ